MALGVGESVGIEICSPHCDRVECIVFWTSKATFETTDSKRWNRYKYNLLLLRVLVWLSVELVRLWPALAAASS